jgi:DMSO/TMAO reductase YedYZ molybdopterin-dependent catalytic subunit
VSTLVVDGEVETRISLSPDDLRAMNRQRVQADDQRGRAIYEGGPLAEILRRAGVSIGRAPLQGRTPTSLVIAASPDGFRAVFTLAELDPSSSDRRVLVAHTRDGRPLGPEGPLRIIAPGDKYPARSVRNVVRLTVVGIDANRRIDE